MIAIINYGAGNLYSISRALENLGAEVRITDSPSVVKAAGAVVLPGVGAFDEAIKHLESHNLISAIKRSVKNGNPFLGICLGMQLLFTKSMEGRRRGLDIIKGNVKRFLKAEKIPHMGWNLVAPGTKTPVWKNIPDPCWMYFAHSYYPEPADRRVIAATTEYGTRFASVVQAGNVLGTQFHPEKSGKDGIQFLKNFLKLK